MSKLSRSDFATWLRRYGAAWEGRDARGAAELFTPDAQYHWTPFDPPQQGHAQIAAAWQAAVDHQRDIRFQFEILALEADTGIAQWRAEFVAEPGNESVRIDGILVAQFSDPEHCHVFREWWHRASGPQ